MVPEGEQGAGGTEGGGGRGRPGSGFVMGVGLLPPPVDRQGNGGGGFTAPTWVGWDLNPGLQTPNPALPQCAQMPLHPRGFGVGTVSRTAHGVHRQPPHRPAFSVGQDALSRRCGAGIPRADPLCASSGVFLQALGKLPESG